MCNSKTLLKVVEVQSRSVSQYGPKTRGGGRVDSAFKVVCMVSQYQSSGGFLTPPSPRSSERVCRRGEERELKYQSSCESLTPPSPRSSESVSQW
ncbi:hypothetical protein E2C01_063019 [Portunus trituberculatus]|uniref:Uncharacterized protein n=1 Tax=Portunus trituberculatus TaxID=210409 RepID=A0A5B7HGD8_PORTR|nr:hypothetical protein [Portunus trituberculatus]